MTGSLFTDRAQSYLQRLCIEIPDRCVGSPGNRAATDFFANTIASFGFAAEAAVFDCLDWMQQGATLGVGWFTSCIIVSFSAEAANRDHAVAGNQTLPAASPRSLRLAPALDRSPQRGRRDAPHVDLRGGRFGQDHLVERVACSLS